MGKLLNNIILASFILVSFSCQNECRDISCKEGANVSFKITNYETSEIIDSLIKVTLESKSYKPRVTSWNEIDFEVMVNNTSEFIIFYNDTLKAIVGVAVTRTKADCCDNYYTNTVIINGEEKCTSDCNKEVFEIEL